MKIKDFLKDYKYPVEKLHLSGFTFQDETLKQFLVSFFEPYNGYSCRFNTLTKDGLFRCGKNKNRTIEETYLIAKTYFPKMKVAEFLATFGEIISDPSWEYVLFFCPDIKEFVLATEWYWEEDDDDIKGGIECPAYKNNFYDSTNAAFVELKRVLGLADD